MPEQNVPPGSVVVTPKDMYDKITETHDAVQRLELVFTPALTHLQDDVKTLKAEVGILQRFRWILVGIAAGLGTAGGGLVSAVIK